MSIPLRKNTSTRNQLEDAHALVDMGVPVFTCRMNSDGDPFPPKKWDKTKPAHDRVDEWHSGLALCAVTGVTFDVIDIDPRNGGTPSYQTLAGELGEHGPEVYWDVKTPSGGRHLYVSPLGIGSHIKFMPGIDLKGGKPDGTSRGFVFLPPTRRRSKAPKADTSLVPYLPRMPLGATNGNGHVTQLKRFIESATSPLELPEDVTGRTDGRVATAVLRERALSAPPGGQRAALLAYVHELERRGYERDDIVIFTRDLVKSIPTYDERRPWREKDIRGLLHKPGQIIGDAKPGELEDEDISPIRSGLVRPVSELDHNVIEWLWLMYLAFRELTLLDGEKARGKTFVTDDIAARASKGLAMPGEGKAVHKPINVIIFTDEGHAESVLKPRLIAAEADQSRVFIPSIRKPKRGQLTDWPLALPDGAPFMERMIREAEAELAIWDPITDFLDEGINSHNDASVRRALRPLNGVLNRTHCAGLALRHMNKDTNQAAKFRGSGSSAFQNRARVHLVTEQLRNGIYPEQENAFGIQIIDSNLARNTRRTLTYAIEDSEVVMDQEGQFVGRVNWLGYLDDGIENLMDKSTRRGPAPSEAREMAKTVLEEMFQEKGTWRADKAKEYLKQMGVTISRPTLDKVRLELGIRSVPRHRRGGIGVMSWDWTTEKERVTG